MISWRYSPSWAWCRFPNEAGAPRHAWARKRTCRIRCRVFLPQYCGAGQEYARDIRCLDTFGAWQHEELLPGLRMSWEGEAGENPLEVSASMVRPYVFVQTFDAEMAPDGSGDAKTMITIAYVPE